MKEDAHYSNRSHLGFPEVVQACFQFLMDDFGYNRVSSLPTFVRYESKEIFVNVYHGRASYEFGVEIGQLGHDKQADGPSYTIEELLSVAGHSQKLRYLAGTTPEVVRLAIQERAEVLLMVGSPFLGGSRILFKELERQRKNWGESFAEHVHLQHVRERAEISWASRDYRDVVSLYESIRDDLTILETKRLEYARKMQ